MFTWIPIHREAAQYLSVFRNRQPELLALLREMRAAGLKTVSLEDQAADGSAIPLQEIDPFTFLANFNRSLRRENRLALWQALRESWGLKAALPSDFEGIPLADFQKAWFMPWAAKREPGHVGLLWELFEQALQGGFAGVKAETFDACLKLHGLGVAYLSFGLFWICPEQFLGTDYRTLALAKNRGVTIAPKNFATYTGWLNAVRPYAAAGFPSFSLEAYQFRLSEEDFQRLFDRFQKRVPDFRNFAESGELEVHELRYKRKALLDVQTRPGFAGARQMVEAGAGQRLLAELRNRAGNLASLYSWSGTFGREDSVAARLLGVLLDVADQPWSGAETVAPLFAAIEAEGLKPAWDTISACLWLFRPDDYFPIKIEDYRKIAQELRQPLPIGRATPEGFAAIRAFGEAFRERLAPFGPRDWTDVQSFIYVVRPMEAEASAPPEPSPLAEPFSRIFDSKDQAEEVFSLFRRAMEQLGLTAESGDDRRVALTLPAQSPRFIRFNFGCFVVCSFFAKSIGENRLEFACLTDLKPEGAVEASSFSQFGQKTDEPAFVLVRVPASWSQQPEMHEVFDPTVDAIRERFSGWESSPWRAHHRPELFRMIFDEAYRHEVLGRGLADLPSPDPAAVKKTEGTPVGQPASAYTMGDALEDLFLDEAQLSTILTRLRHKRNIILQGAPGVGKTFVAERIAFALMGAADNRRLKAIQFHQSYGYEDFIQGWRPNAQGGFTLRDGHFYEFCRRAQADPEHDYVLVIDEINRGNLSRIFGELMVLLEPDKRGARFAMPLTYSNEPFYVPERLHLIGLMNTADRSLAMVDYALRRRFAFMTIEPAFGSPNFVQVLGRNGISTGMVTQIRRAMDGVNRLIEEDTASLGRGYLVGHSFFVPRFPIADEDVWYEGVVTSEILPLLHEYWVDDPERFKQAQMFLLGNR